MLTGPALAAVPLADLLWSLFPRSIVSTQATCPGALGALVSRSRFEEELDRGQQVPFLFWIALLSPNLTHPSEPGDRSLKGSGLGWSSHPTGPYEKRTLGFMDPR